VQGAGFTHYVRVPIGLLYVPRHTKQTASADRLQTANVLRITLVGHIVFGWQGAHLACLALSKEEDVNTTACFFP